MSSYPGYDDTRRCYCPPDLSEKVEELTQKLKQFHGCPIDKLKEGFAHALEKEKQRSAAILYQLERVLPLLKDAYSLYALGKVPRDGMLDLEKFNWEFNAERLLKDIDKYIKEAVDGR